MAMTAWAAKFGDEDQCALSVKGCTSVRRSAIDADRECLPAASGTPSDGVDSPSVCAFALQFGNSSTRPACQRRWTVRPSSDAFDRDLPSRRIGGASRIRL